MLNIFDLSEKTVVLTGGRGYLGANFCEALLGYGAIVHSLDISSEYSEKIKNLIEKYPNKFFNHECDCTSKDALFNIKNKILNDGFTIDVLINAVTMKGDDFYLPFEKVSVEGWNIGILGNLTSPFVACQVFIPDMVKKQAGSVINISSIYGIVGNDQRIYKGSNLDDCYLKDGHAEKEEQVYSHAVYPAAKGGVISLTRYLAAYYGKDNVRVNCVTPGGVYNPLENDEFLKKYSERTPLGRKANPDEINGAIVYLASDASTYVTGHNLVVDGGWTCW